MINEQQKQEIMNFGEVKTYQKRSFSGKIIYREISINGKNVDIEDERLAVALGYIEYAQKLIKENKDVPESCYCELENAKEWLENGFRNNKY